MAAKNDMATKVINLIRKRASISAGMERQIRSLDRLRLEKIHLALTEKGNEAQIDT